MAKKNRNKIKKVKKVKAQGFQDGVSSFSNSLINQRNALNTNAFAHTQMDDTELSAVFKNGTFSKIIRIKTGYALKNAFDFSSTKDETFYNENIAKQVKRACMYQLGFGRGVIVIGMKGDDLAKPLANGSITLSKMVLRVFDKTKVSTQDVGTSLMADRYMKPGMYSVNGEPIHWTRVIDFTYYEPIEDDLPNYDYAGVSEAELILDELKQKGIITRANASIVEKMSTVFYQVDGFKEKLATKQENTLLSFFAQLETMRGMYGAGIIDKNDDVKTVSQTLSGIKDIYDIAMNGLALVTGIPVPMLIGENVKGLNSTGDTERQIFNDNMDAYLADYIFDRVNELFIRIGMDPVTISESNNLSAVEQVNYDKAVVEVADKLRGMGEDHHSYLEDKGLVKEDPLFDFDTTDDIDQSVDPAAALNGAQVKSMYDIIVGVSMGELPKSTGIQMLVNAFPIDEAQATELMRDVVEGSTKPLEAVQ